MWLNKTIEHPNQSVKNTCTATQTMIQKADTDRQTARKQKDKDENKKYGEKQKKKSKRSSFLAVSMSDYKLVLRTTNQLYHR